MFSLNVEVDKIDIDRSKTAPVDLSKLRNVVENEAVKKKTVYDKLVAKKDNVHTRGFVLKSKDNTDKQTYERKDLILVDLLKDRL